MSPQSPCSRHVNPVHRGALVLVAITTCLSAHAAVTAARPPDAAFADRQEPRPVLAGAHGRPLRMLAPDVVSVRPSVPIAAASRREPFEGQRPFALAPRAPAAQRSMHGEDDPSSRSAAALALHWQDRPEWERNLRSYRRGGAPLVHLWQSSHAVVGIGVSRRGIAGIYLTQTLSP